jgi:hypothetical protein
MRSRGSLHDGRSVMADLFVVFEGEDCVGLAATLDDATCVVQARLGDQFMSIDWAPITPHGWVVPGTTYRAVLKPVTNSGAIQATSGQTPDMEHAAPRRSGTQMLRDQLRRIQDHRLVKGAGSIVIRVRRRVARHAGRSASGHSPPSAGVSLRR